MKRRKSGSSAPGKVAEKKKKYTTKGKIDFSDIPELSAEQLQSMKRVGRPSLGDSPRQLIAIRLDPAILDKIRQLAESAGKGYQTLINEILAQYINKKTA